MTSGLRPTGTKVGTKVVICLALALGMPASALAQAQAPSRAQPQARPPAALNEGVAAIVNDDIISSYDLSQRMRLLIATSGVQPTPETLNSIQAEALRTLVDERLQFQELRRVEKEQKFDIVATDDDIDEEIADLARGNSMTPDQMIGVLSSQGIGALTFKDQLRAQVSWQRWIQGRYGSRLRIGKEQVKTVQQRLSASISKPQFLVSEVLIDASRVGGMSEAMAGAQQLIAQIQKGAPIASVARQFSASPSAANGGDTGWVTSEELAAEVAPVVEQLRPGQIANPIQTRDGVYIVQLRDRRSGAGTVLISLKQAAVPLPQSASASELAAATGTLNALRGQIRGCAGLEPAVARAPGVIASDLGEADSNDLAPAFKTAAEGLQIDQVSEPLRTQAGLHLLVLCDRKASGGGMPSDSQIENRLIAQQLAMISRRYMRDLRASATIETRQ